MFVLLRYTESLGFSAVPETFDLIRLCLCCLASTFFNIVDGIIDYVELFFLTSCLSGFSSDVLSDISDSFPLVWFGLLDRPYFRSEESNRLLVYPLDRDTILNIRIDGKSDSFRSGQLYLVGETGRKDKLCRGSDLELVSDSDDFKTLLESVRDTGNHVTDKRAGKSPESSLVGILCIGDGYDQFPFGLLQFNEVLEVLRQFSFRSHDLHEKIFHFNGDSRRDLDRRFSDS